MKHSSGIFLIVLFCTLSVYSVNLFTDNFSHLHNNTVGLSEEIWTQATNIFILLSVVLNGEQLQSFGLSLQKRS